MDLKRRALSRAFRAEAWLAHKIKESATTQTGGRPPGSQLLKTGAANNLLSRSLEELRAQLAEGGEKNELDKLQPG
ncbi:MAG: hypothetical protein ACE5LV_05920 [Candidatus Aminicenantales bacterium]